MVGHPQPAPRQIHCDRPVKRWFGDVPREVKVAGVTLQLAHEAIDKADPDREGPQDGVRGERPNPDYPAEMVLRMALLELDEMVRVLGEMVSTDLDGWSRSDIVSAVEHHLNQCDIEGEEPDWAYEWEVVQAGLQLRDALNERVHVSHGFEIDGSITITIGPNIPELTVLGLGSSDDGELEDEPDHILAIAVDLVASAADLHWAARAAEWRRDERRAAPPENVRSASGWPVFVAATAIDLRRDDVDFPDALALARLVLLHDGGPASIRGKAAVMDGATAKRLTRLGLVIHGEAGQILPLLQTTSTSVNGEWHAAVTVGGTRDRAEWVVAATADGRRLTTTALVAGPKDALGEGEVQVRPPIAPEHAPLDRQSFGQMEFEFGKADPDADEVARAVRGLIQEAMTYRDGPDVLNLMKTVGRFTTLAPFNALLLDAQRPGSRHVLPAHKWQETFRHRVKAGERPQLILRPFGPVLPVFDVSQVEPVDEDSPQLPRRITDPFGMPPVIGADEALRKTVEAVKADGIRVTFTRDGASSAGSARTVWSEGNMAVVRGGKTLQIPVIVDIHINSDLDPSAAYITLAHELGHVYCGHLGSRDTSMWPDRKGVNTVAAECEAEGVAYIAGLRLDPGVQMPPHLAQYLDPGSPVPPVDLNSVTKAAGLIINFHESPAEVWRRRSDRLSRAARKK